MRSTTKDHQIPTTTITLMGVSGCGKTTIGTALADRIGWEFIESDNYHSTEDICKMSTGIPLTDEDRWPWLERLHALLREKQNAGVCVVLACSALKESYRRLLHKELAFCEFVFLKGNFDLIRSRMRERAHFMKPEMLQSQFDALEEPPDAFVVDIRLSVDKIVNSIINRFTIG